jgi:succinate-semialdehyde dehydrogenase / glutarate-semialdehyde dehydrogenase
MTAHAPSPLAGAPTDLFVGGDWRPGADARRFDVLDPADGSVIASVAAATAADGLAAVDAAAAAGPDWAARPPRERAEHLRRAFDLMTARREEIAALIVSEMGKPLAEARVEADYAAEFLRWFSEEAVRADGAYGPAPSGAHRILVLQQPVGVAVLVTPWNFPAAMATRKIGPALAAGCTVVLKPAEETPLTTLAIAAILEAAGVPPGVVNVLPANDPGPLVRAMLEDPRVRKLSFTGSTEVGRLLLGLAAGRVLNCSMELGGNAPFLVLEDADLDSAVLGAMAAKMRNGGEACTAANRFIVAEPVADAFTERLAAAMAAVPVGPGFEPGAELGPLITEEAREKVERLVADACDRGARVRTGGHRLDRPGYFYAPTVLDRVAPRSALLDEEIFGPVAPVQTYADERDAIAMANDTEHGLVGYVYSRDLRRAMAIGEAIECGMIGLNRGTVSDPAAPFGGVKQSGVGREGGHAGLLEFLEPKYFAFD